MSSQTLPSPKSTLRISIPAMLTPSHAPLCLDAFPSVEWVWLEEILKIIQFQSPAVGRVANSR